jgi:hypothetical protein
MSVTCARSVVFSLIDIVFLPYPVSLICINLFFLSRHDITEILLKVALKHHQTNVVLNTGVIELEEGQEIPGGEILLPRWK